MRGRWMVMPIAVALAVALVLPAVGQGRGRGGWAQGGGRWGGGYGQGFGRGAGGWWARVNPATPEQAALIRQMSELHAKIRTLNWEIADQRSRNGAPSEIAAREQMIAEHRKELAKLTSENEKLIREMGVPAPYGVCNGNGRRMGGGRFGTGPIGGRGNGLRLRDGSGPNPNCLLKKP